MITLAQLEQEVARRTGPFFQASQDSGVPTSSTTIAAYMPVLKTSALLGGPENLWLLRRGRLAGGAPTPVAVDPADRERMVLSFDAGAGRVQVDRNWRNPMQPDELADFTHLHPEQELRVAVLAGLRRCFLAELLAGVASFGGGYVDLTAAYPWLVGADQVVGLQSGMAPHGNAPFTTVMSMGHVMLSGGWAGRMWVTALRPAWSLVNGAESTTGPTADGDELQVDLDYAASAAHIEAWHLFPAHLFAAAAGNLQATQEMAAREFTRQSLIWGPSPPRSVGFSESVGLPLQNSVAR